MSDETLQIIRTVRDRLRSTGRKILLARLLRGLFLTAGGAAGLWAILAAVEAVFWMAPTIRTVCVSVAGLLLLGVVAVTVVIPLLGLVGVAGLPDPERVAHSIERALPAARDRLVNFIHLSSGKHSDSPPELIEAALETLYANFRTAPFESVEDYRIVRRSLKVSLGPLLMLVLFALILPSSFRDASNRLLHPQTAFTAPTPFSLIVEPGDVAIVRGDSVRIVVDVRGTAAGRPELQLNAPGIQPTARLVGPVDKNGTYHHTRTNVRGDFQYRAALQEVTSPWYSVTVLDRPIVRDLRVSVVTPRYSRLGTFDLEPDAGDVTALVGSDVRLDVGLGGADVTEAFVVFDKAEKKRLSIEGGRARGSFRLTREDTYRIALTSSSGVENDSPIRYRLHPVADQDPTIEVTQPSLVEKLIEPFEPTISFRITDDFGFSRAVLFYRLAESRFGAVTESFSELDITIAEPRRLDQLVDQVWNILGTVGQPVPGDVIEYYLRAWDNDSYAGYKPASSRVHRFIMPSLAELYEQMDQSSDDAADNLEELIRKAKDASDRFRELRDEVRRKAEPDWDDQRSLDELRQVQEEMEDGLGEVARELDELSQQMRENSLVSDETLEMMEELQKTVEEIRSPELMEALQKLREAMQNLDPQLMQQSLQNFEFDEEQFRQRLERALELFKRLQIQQGLEEAARRAQELEELQENLQQDTRELSEQQEQSKEGRETRESDAANESERLAKEQDRSASEMESLQERLRELQQQMEEIPRTSPKQLEELRSRLEQQDLPEQMRQNAQELRNQQMDPAMQGQQQMQQQLGQLRESLEQMQSAMRGRQLQLNIAGLRQVLNDVLILSQDQEGMRHEVSETETDSPSLRPLARRQIELGEGLRVVSDTLLKLSREIPEMSREVQVQTGAALREMQQATEALAGRSARRAAGHQKASMMHLNELALLLSDLLSRMMSQQMGMGMPSMQQLLDQLQQMGGQQEQLNQQIQQMLNDMQGQRLTSDMQARMRQLAQQQEQLKQQLKELSRNRELRGKALGDLDKIAEQMEESVRQLQQTRIDRQLIERQQQILTRLLEASKSINQRGRERRRESRTGDDQVRESPDPLTPDERATQLRRDLIRALESGYAPDYEELIRRYFELLQESASPSIPEGAGR